MSAKESAAKGGVGYAPEFREQALHVVSQSSAELKEDKVADAADIFGVSGRSIYRWAARQQQTGNVQNLEHKVAYPNVRRCDYAKWLSGVLGMEISEAMIEDAMKRLEVTHKHIKKIAVEQDPVRNLFFDICPPPLGKLGVSLNDFVDLDESYVFLCESDRQTGYAFVGKPALVTSQYIKGVKWTVMLAVSYRGLVAYWVHKENTSGQVYAEFLEEFVFPKLDHKHYILNDNLAAHFTGPAINVLAASGHEALQRPPSNPDRAPVEFYFHLMKDKLKLYRPQLTEQNLPQFIAKAIEELPWEDAPAIFGHCGYT